MGILNLLLPLLSNVLPDVIKRVLPGEKISEVDSANLQQQLALALMEQDWKTLEAQYADLASARNLAAMDISHGNALTSALSAIVRPIWGIGGFVLIAYSWYLHTPIDPALKDIISLVLQFYFGGKVIESITPHLSEALATFGRK